MYNCYRILCNGRIYAIVPSEQRAETIITVLQQTSIYADSLEWSVEPAYIENIGF